MLKYMVIKVAYNYLDIWTEIIAYDLSDHQDAQDAREEYLLENPAVDPDNISVVQYKE